MFALIINPSFSLIRLGSGFPLRTPAIPGKKDGELPVCFLT